ncbi:hypothetical protein GCM10022198_05570 [Klugiella xanthotipulae]|uniref:Uncharacterized protein n=1 Tax=Klugiella xanthotipulae TaxID=244735 RepID=A0A543HS73_9MICO|nr:hypothetical protein [Klugiella xanthotipulae]TQM61188.1 hypothetical protein FB466_2128 [Klugiella xanthotipulae]
MPEPHPERITSGRAYELIQHTPEPAPDNTTEPAEQTDQPPLYDTGLDASEGLWVRAGWAGSG